MTYLSGSCFPVEKVIPLIGEMSQSDKRVYKAVEQSETEGSKENNPSVFDFVKSTSLCTREAI